MANTATDLYSHIEKGADTSFTLYYCIHNWNFCFVYIRRWQRLVQQLWETVKRTGDALWWASGVKVHSHPGAGAIWFLFSLFWAKTIIDGLNLMFPGKHMGYILAFVGLMGIAIGSKGKMVTTKYGYHPCRYTLHLFGNALEEVSRIN